MLASTSAEAKASKAAVHYRDYPKGMQMCHMCKFYIAGGGRRSGGDVHGRQFHDGDDGSRSLPSSPRQDQPDGLVRPVCSWVSCNAAHVLTGYGLSQRGL